MGRHLDVIRRHSRVTALNAECKVRDIQRPLFRAKGCLPERHYLLVTTESGVLRESRDARWAQLCRVLRNALFEMRGSR